MANTKLTVLDFTPLRFAAESIGISTVDKWDDAALFILMNLIKEHGLPVYLDTDYHPPKQTFLRESEIIEVHDAVGLISIDQLKPDEQYNIKPAVSPKKGGLFIGSLSENTEVLNGEIISISKYKIGTSSCGTIQLKFNSFRIDGLVAAFYERSEKKIIPVTEAVDRFLMKKEDLKQINYDVRIASNLTPAPLTQRPSIWVTRYDVTLEWLRDTAYQISGTPKDLLNDPQKCYNICNQYNRLTKAELWDELKKIKPDIFRGGKDDFFKKTTMPFDIVFQSGRPR